MIEINFVLMGFLLALSVGGVGVCAWFSRECRKSAADFDKKTSVIMGDLKATSQIIADSHNGLVK